MGRRRRQGGAKAGHAGNPDIVKSDDLGWVGAAGAGAASALGRRNAAVAPIGAICNEIREYSSSGQFSRPPASEAVLINGQDPPTKPQVFLKKYVLFAFVFMVFFLPMAYIDGHANSRNWYLIGLLSSLLLVILGAIYVVIFAIKVVDGQFLGALSVLSGVSIFAILFVAGPFVFLSIDYFRLIFLQTHYQTTIAGSPANAQGKRVVLFDWGRPWISSSNFHVLVYDETEEVTLPAEVRSEYFRRRVAENYPMLAYGPCKLRVHNLRGHFYQVSAVCCMEQEGKCT